MRNFSYQRGSKIFWKNFKKINNPINIKKPIEYLKELHAIYCASHNHTAPQNENDESDFRKHITTITNLHEAKADCIHGQIVKEFKSI